MLYILTLLVATLGALVHTAPADYPVCVVGAGPAGLTAANRLENKGFKTVIFEKQPEVGGKCQAYYDNGGFHPLGALLFSNGTYTETLKVIDAAGVPIYPFSSSGGGEGWMYNWTTGVAVPIPAVTASFATVLQAEIAKYIGIWTQKFAPISAVGYKNGIPQEFTFSTADWLSQNGFQALPVLMIQAMVPYGYGDFRQVPILYMLQYLTPDIILFFAGQHNGYLIDFHEVWTQYSKSSIKGPIYLNTDIDWINRDGPFPIICYSTKDYRRQIQKCSSLILAFPPTLSALQDAHLDLSPSEKSVFGPVGINDYYSGAVRVQTPFGLVFRVESPSPITPPDATGEPVAFLHLSPASDVATTWSWGPYRVQQTVEQAKELLKATLYKLNKDPRVANATAKPVTDADVLAFRKWDYFPHFDSEQLAGGWYDKFNKLQGMRKTYYASGLNGFETVEFAIRAGADVVNSYFSKYKM